MPVIKRNPQKGFSAVELVLLLLVVGLISFLGWYVWRQKYAHKDNSQAAATQGGTEAHSALRTYDDSRFSMRYPATWTVDATGKNIPGESEVVFASPNDSTINLVGPNGSGQYPFKRLLLRIVPDHKDFTSETFVKISPTITKSDASCADQEGSCTVYAVVPLSNPNLPGAKLVISDFDGGNGHPTMLNVVDDTSVATGKRDVRLGLTVYGTVRLVDAYVQCGQDVTLAASDCWIADVHSFMGTSGFKSLVTSLNSLNFAR